MESFLQSCDKSLDYPQHLVTHDTLNHSLQAYHERLERQSKRLFDENEASVDFLDLCEGENEYIPNRVKDLEGLKQQLREALRPERSDPQCRFIFMHAPHSRAPLRVSVKMLKFLFSYHQIMPSFLDFVFPFGKQIYLQDFHFSGLREESLLREDTGIAELGRSGSELRLCYNLRSVEPTKDKSDLPWSIRQAALYHTFDIKTARAVWVVVKGNHLIKNRITEATRVTSRSGGASQSEAFSATLATHLLMCDWSGENWRWYINELEDQCQALTRGVLATQVDNPPSPVSPVASDPFSMSPRSWTSTIPPLSPSPTGHFSKDSRAVTGSLSTRINSGTPQSILPLPSLGMHASPYPHKSASISKMDAGIGLDNRVYANDVNRPQSNIRNLPFGHGVEKWVAKLQFWKDTPNRCSPPMCQIEMNNTTASSTPKLLPEELPPTFFEKEEESPRETFTFRDLQRIQYIEEKTQETHLVLGLNIQVLADLRQHYKHATDHAKFPGDIRKGCQENLSRFDRCVLGVQKDLQMLQSKTQNLLDLLANRKNLLNGILQYRSVKASEFFAKKAQLSADHMETMTIEMHEIAKKTKQETVSMRVITSVTLFFLPATFIATFMSTDILNFEHGKQDFQMIGLRVYLAIAVPLTALTFFAWYVIYRVAKRTGLQSSVRSANDSA